MATVGDFKLRKRDAGPRLQQVLADIVQILNEDSYQRKVYSAAPTSSSPGYEGEKRLARVGATLREYFYDGSQWWQSDNTATTGWSTV